MRRVPSRLACVAGAAAMLIAVGGCARIRTHNGYMLDPLLVDSIQPGIDNRASVEASLGRPTFTSQFGPELWYYVSRDMEQLAFRQPRPKDQTLLKVSFDAAGRVAAVERAGIEQVARINPSGDKTQTLGRERSLFEEIFGNIGAVGAAGGGGGAGPAGP